MRRAEPAGSFAQANAGMAAVEFACIMPIFLLLLLSATEYGRAMAVSRKVTLTTRTVADLTTQYTQMMNSDLSAVLNASAQVMAPYPTTGLTVVLSEITTNIAGISTVTWSRSLNGTPLTQGQIIALPVGVAQAGASVILSQVSYLYVPFVSSGVISPFTMSNTLYMSPRSSATVNLTGS